MVHIDWDRIRAAKAVSLRDDEIEDLFPMVIRCEIEEVDDIYNLRALMKLSQEMLLYKDNQVETLLLECDEMKEKLLSSKNINKDGNIETENSNSKMNIHSIDDKNIESLQLKNDKIKALILELESLEKENVSLKEKLGNFKEEMEDAIDNMNEMTEELNNLRSKNSILNEEIDYFKRERKALLNQIEEITIQQADRDRIIDEFSGAMDIRVLEWKDILESKNNEIVLLKNELSKFQSHCETSVNTPYNTQIIYLNEEIDKRDKIIQELESKVLEAAVEITDSAKLIEKFKLDIRQMEKSGRRKEHQNLLKKILAANEKILNLQTSLNNMEDNLTAKSEQLCEVLGDLKKYEDRDHGLAETINELKELKKQLLAKDNYIQDIVNVINKLEALNSHQEMQIISLREKLGLSEDDNISIEGITLRYQEEAKIKFELLKKTELLEEENINLKSDIRILKHKLMKLSKNTGITHNTTDPQIKSEGVPDTTAIDWKTNQHMTVQRHQSDLEEIQDNLRIAIEENEALRQGMHEIMDSIRDQDGKSTVTIHSDTLERLLEALDARHIAGWYHPAMRLQERLNVVEGSNSELRTQLKNMRKEIKQKDTLVHQLNEKSELKDSKYDTVDADNKELMLCASEIQEIPETYKKQMNEWQHECETLKKENNDLKEVNEKMNAQLEIFNVDLKAIVDSGDELKVALASRSKECAELATNLIISNRKCTIMEEMLNRESEKIYNLEKEASASESAYKKLVADLEKRNDLLDSSLLVLESNLSNSVTKSEFNQLKEKYNEVNLRLRILYECRLVVINDDEYTILKNQMQTNDDRVDDQSIGEVCDILKQKESQIPKNLPEMYTINTDLQEQLIQLQKLLNKELQASEDDSQKNKINALEEDIKLLRIENKNLMQSLKISRDEAHMYYTINSLKILEVDNLRHQILDLQAISEDKETIARLGFQLSSCKAAEMEMNRYKTQLENEILQLRNNLEAANDKCHKTRMQLEHFRRTSDNKCRNYEDIIDFLQNQYSGSTSLSSLQRFEVMLKRLIKNRAQIDLQLKEIADCNEKAKIQQETLTNRLEIVDSLKDILEQKIGGSELDNLMHRFSENSQNTINEYQLKRQIMQLENELQMTAGKLLQYESTIIAMECDMISMQKTWKNKIQSLTLIHNSPIQQQESPITSNKKSVSVEARTENQSVQVQCDLSQIMTTSKVLSTPVESVIEQKIEKVKHDNVELSNTILFLQDQLSQALALASDRSAKLIKYESQIIEYEAKISALDKTIADKNAQFMKQTKLLEQQQTTDTLTRNDVEGSDTVALQSTINSLQKIISQKEETIIRYQKLLQEDRDEHNKVTFRLQEEIKNLRISVIKEDIEQHKSQKNINDESTRGISHVKTADELKNHQKVIIETEEKIVRLNEQVSTLDANLHIANELSERWRRLADERLNHMDEVREKLEAQHKGELDSYRLEIDKWQSETTALREQLSKIRMNSVKGNISLSKELQERDNKIEELTMLNQQLQSELEMMESMGNLQPQVTGHSSGVNKIQELAQSFGHHDSNNHIQAELDLIRRQYKSITEKEIMYKEQIADLRQQLSRRYVAEKTEGKRVSQREAQLERKLKNMEEELNKTKMQLDKEYRNHEVKRIKTAEELLLWEKQKKWQQIAEKLKKELKVKTDEYKKLNVNCDKLKAIVSCMEREKWYLRSKIRSENENVNSGLSARTDLNVKIVEDLQKECQTLRDRISELTDRLETEDNHQLMLQVEKQKQRIDALEIVTKGNTFIVDQLEKLESIKCTLEKANVELESDNFELRMELEKVNLDIPRLTEKVCYLEKYVELLKNEKSSESSLKSLDIDQDQRSKKSLLELERTIFVLKRIIEKLQVENKRLKINSRCSSKSIKCASVSATKVNNTTNNDLNLKKQYEQAKKRVIALETDLQLADQRIEMLMTAQADDDNTNEISVLKQQLAHKSELLNRVKQLLTRAAINEKVLRQRIHQIESKQTLSTIPECLIATSPHNS